MFRRGLLDQVGVYDDQLEGTEDYDLWLRFAEVTSLAKVPLILLSRAESAQTKIHSIALAILKAAHT